MDTERLIAQLAQSASPVRHLPSPWHRIARWLAWSIPYLALVVVAMSPRSDLGSKLGDTKYVVEQLAALATAFTAGFAAFASVVPGYDRRLLLAPLPPLAVWLGSVGAGCLQSFVQYGPHGLSIQPDWMCIPAIAFAGLVPAATLAVMLRRGAPLTPRTTTMLAGLAAAGLGNFALRLFHPQDASVMVLVWQMGTVFVLTALSGCCGRLLLDWRYLLADRHRKLTG
jgi:hypothetical protein